MDVLRNVFLRQVLGADMEDSGEVIPAPFRCGDFFVRNNRGRQKVLIDSAVGVEKFRAGNKLG